MAGKGYHGWSSVWISTRAIDTIKVVSGVVE